MVGRGPTIEWQAYGAVLLDLDGVITPTASVHERAWATLFEPAIALARDGFGVSPRLHSLLSAEPHLADEPEAGRHFFDPQRRPPGPLRLDCAMLSMRFAEN